MYKASVPCRRKSPSRVALHLLSVLFQIQLAMIQSLKLYSATGHSNGGSEPSLLSCIAGLRLCPLQDLRKDPISLLLVFPYVSLCIIPHSPFSGDSAVTLLPTCNITVTSSLIDRYQVHSVVQSLDFILFQRLCLV